MCGFYIRHRCGASSEMQKSRLFSRLLEGFFETVGRLIAKGVALAQGFRLFF